MGKLVNMFTRVAIWGAVVAGTFYIGTVLFMYFFAGGALNHAFDSDGAMRAALLGGVVGAVVGFFKKN